METTDLPSPAEASNTELECLLDDPSDPSELTVFAPGTDSLATEWLTIDWDAAHSLDRLR